MEAQLKFQESAQNGRLIAWVDKSLRPCIKQKNSLIIFPDKNVNTNFTYQCKLTPLKKGKGFNARVMYPLKWSANFTADSLEGVFYDVLCRFVLDTADYYDSFSKSYEVTKFLTLAEAEKELNNMFKKRTVKTYPKSFITRFMDAVNLLYSEKTKSQYTNQKLIR